MKKSVSFVVALLLAGSASLAIAQFRPEANNLTGIPNWNSEMPGYRRLRQFLQSSIHHRRLAQLHHRLLVHMHHRRLVHTHHRLLVHIHHRLLVHIHHRLFPTARN
jgi:hypothetical protein